MALAVLMLVITPACNSIWCGLKEWQTLISGVLALIAAYLTISPMRRQMKQLQEVERLLLPFSSSEICDYATQSAKLFLDLIDFENGTILPVTDTIEIPALPAKAIDNLQKFSSSAPSEMAHATHKLIGKLQVHHARQTKQLAEIRKGDDINRGTLDELVIHAITIYCMTYPLFRYGRSATNEEISEIDYADLQSAIRVMTELGEKRFNFASVIHGYESSAIKINDL